MQKIFLVLIVLTLLVGCSSAPSVAELQQTVQVYVKATVDSLPTQTPNIPTQAPPTKTPEPTATIQPTSTPLSSEELSKQFNEITKTFLAGFEDIESINLIRGVNGVLQIEVKCMWASRDRQPPLSYELIKGFAESFFQSQGFSESDLARFTNGTDKFSVEITTYSTDNDYKYHSITDYQTLEKVYNSAITYDEWITLAQAGFK
ncbi:MAG: hypothetical protein C0410_01880 [Anaerolinea sp.]|nr:hypothetical protein [Anaerolinea sp.]